MTERPRLTIITITYNAPGALGDTLRSLTPLLRADYAWEQVIIDGSPDLNAEVLARAPTHAFLRQIAEAPRGIYPAMNRGLREARGEVFWFLNAGDTLEDSGALADALATLGREPGCHQLLAGAALARDGELLHIQHPRAGTGALLGINRICHQAMLFRRSVFERLGPFPEDLRFASDYEFHLRAQAAGLRTLLLDEVLVRYDMSGASAANAGAVFAEFARVQARLRAEGKLTHFFLHQLIRNLEYVRVRAFRLLAAGPAGSALRRLWHSLRRRFS